MGRIWPWFAIVCAVVFGSMLGTADAGGRQLGIVAQVPPGGLDFVDVQLLDEEGVDVLDQYCYEQLSGYAQYLPGYSCEELPDGTYRLAIGEVPDGWLVDPFDCRPFGAEVVDTFTVVGGSGAPEQCIFVASPPVLLLSLMDFSGIGAEFAFDVHDRDGRRVELRCEPETRVGYWGEWCFDLPFGDLEVTLAGGPVGYRESVYCGPQLSVSSSSDQYGPSISVSAEHFYWSCSAEIQVPLRILFYDHEQGVLDDDDVAFTVTNPDADVTEHCREVDLDVGFEGASNRTFDCLGLERGSYLIEPSSDRVDMGHCVVEVGAESWGACEFHLLPDRTPPTATESAEPVTSSVIIGTTTPSPAASTTTAPPATTLAAAGAGDQGAVDAEGSGRGRQPSWYAGVIGGIIGGIVGGVVVLAASRRRS